MYIRKRTTILEVTEMEMGIRLYTSLKKSAVIVVVKNPYSGVYSADLGCLVNKGEYLGSILGSKAVEALCSEKEECEGYGKAAIIGLHGEIEHGHAILHEKFGAPVREFCGGGKAIIPSTVKIGGPGTEIDVPTVYKHKFNLRTHYDSMPVRIHDAPKDNEILVALVVTSSGRPLPR